jgi:hypothetical protein
MAVTLLSPGRQRQGSALIKRSISDVVAAPRISPVPISCGTRSLTAPVLGSPLATTSMQQSTLRRVSRHISRLSKQTFRSFKIETKIGRGRITDAVYQWFAELQLFQGKDQRGKSEKTLRAYNYRLGFFLDFAAQHTLTF